MDNDGKTRRNRRFSRSARAKRFEDEPAANVERVPALGSTRSVKSFVRCDGEAIGAVVGAVSDDDVTTVQHASCTRTPSDRGRPRWRTFLTNYFTGRAHGDFKWNSVNWLVIVRFFSRFSKFQFNIHSTNKF